MSIRMYIGWRARWWASEGMFVSDGDSTFELFMLVTRECDSRRCRFVF